MLLYLRSILIYIKSDMEYKSSFLMTIFASMVSAIIEVLATIILLDRFKEIGGYTIEQVMIFTGIAVFGNAITEMFAKGLDIFHKQVKNGILDRALLRPRSITLQVLCSDFQFSKIGRTIGGLALMIYALINANISWTIYKALVLLMVILGSIVVNYSMILLKASFSFWTIEGMEVMNIITYGGRMLSSYPLSIYKKWFRNLFTYIIPYGLICYYPLVYLMGKSDNAFYGITPIFTLIFLALGYKIWNFGLKSYQSVGS